MYDTVNYVENLENTLSMMDGANDKYATGIQLYSGAEQELLTVVNLTAKDTVLENIQ